MKRGSSSQRTPMKKERGLFSQRFCDVIADAAVRA